MFQLNSGRVLTGHSVAIFLLGISSGIPYLLVFGTLSAWTAKAGIDRATIGFLSWVSLAYAFKFVWAPLADNLPLPLLTSRLGKRRSWIFFSQILILIALLWMSLWDPSESQFHLVLLVGGAILLAFSSATQDIVIDAYRIEVATKDQQALLAGLFVPGYRVGMILAGVGLFEVVGLLEPENSYDASAWQLGYRCMAVAMLIGVITTFLIKEPKTSINAEQKASPGRLFTHFIFVVIVFVVLFVVIAQLKQQITPEFSRPIEFLFQAFRLGLALSGALITGRLLCQIGLLQTSEFRQVYVSPFSDFFGRFGSLAVMLLLVICFYRTADIVMGVMAKVFYVDMGYTIREIGRITFVFGTLVTLAGGVVGGLLTLRFGIMRMLMAGAVCSALSNLIFVVLANQPGPSVTLLTAAIIADNLSGGLATAVGVAFLSSLTAKKFGATQYAAFVSVTLLFPSLIAGYSGSMIEAVGYSWFFTITAIMGVPVLVLICLIWRPYNQLMSEQGTT